ncbi:MAG TPA: UDP-N-acetylmuramate--L-alanine ligase [Saprospiraceae bacterium]|nr:UDP-N-acetylmuramate--L-alanine ligase [Saprospiraceae bacterium]
MYKNLYFIGIGGIGMSALARYFNKRGVQVCGYDKTQTPLTQALEDEGIRIHYDDDPAQIPADTELVIRTPAVPPDLKIFQDIQKKNIPVVKRSEILGRITAGTRNIAVAGTHGKTTTSILIAHLLYDAGVELTAFLGGIATNYQSNFLDRGDAWMVEEADEYDRSFLQLHPTHAVIGSLDADHLDIYGSPEAMVENYLAFAGQIKSGGMLLLSDSLSGDQIKRFRTNCPNLRIHTFGLDSPDIKVAITGTDSGWTSFSYIKENINMKNLALRMPGQHNIRNAAAAIAIAMEAGVSEDGIRSGLQSFKGIQRRFEWIRETRDQVLIDDYAHHPEELRAAISACRSMYPGRHLTGIFQPHLYSRTRDFMDAFAEVLALLDRVILVEIYPAREAAIPGISSETLFERIAHQDKILTSQSALCGVLRRLELDVVMTLGAGDLDQMQDQISAAIFDRHVKTEVKA